MTGLQGSLYVSVTSAIRVMLRAFVVNQTLRSNVADEYVTGSPIVGTTRLDLEIPEAHSRFLTLVVCTCPATVETNSGR